MDNKMWILGYLFLGVLAILLILRIFQALIERQRKKWKDPRNNINRNRRVVHEKDPEWLPTCDLADEECLKVDRNSILKQLQGSIKGIHTITGTKNRYEAAVANYMTRKFKRNFDINKRYDFLKNPETGKNLELDVYCPDIKLAVEIQGAQHYEFPNKFHETEEQFYKQVERDHLKKKLCEKHGIYLIVIPHTVELKEYDAYLDNEVDNFLAAYEEMLNR